MRIFNKISFLLFAIIIISCKKETDSNLANSDDEFSQVFSNKKLSLEYRKENALKKLDLLKKKGNSKENRNELVKVSDFFLENKLRKEYNESLDLILEKSIQAKDSSLIASAYNKKANSYIDYNKLDSSYLYFIKSEKILLKLKDSLQLGKNFLEKGYVQVTVGDYFGCEQSSSQALLYLKNFNLPLKEYFAYNYIGISSNELKNSESAIHYHKKAYQVAKKYLTDEGFHFQSVSLNNIGVVYQNLSNHKEAIKNFNLALNEKNLLRDNPDLYVKLNDNLAYSKLKLGDFRDLPGLFIKSLKISDSLKLSSGSINKVHISEYYQTVKDTAKSIYYAEKALNQSKSQKSYGEILSSLKQLSVVDKKNSSKYYAEYIKLNDSLQIEERKSKEKFARIAFETDEIIKEKDKLEEQNRTLLYVSLVVGIILTLLFILRAQRARTRELIYKQAQQKANEEIFNLMISQQNVIDESRKEEKLRIARDLHDGVLGRMFGVRLNLDSLNNRNDEESTEKRHQYINELKDIEQDIREISHDLNREKQALINNFVSIINKLLEEQSHLFSTNLKYYIDDKIIWDKINNTSKINLYRILQESLQNINKYAEAKHIFVELKKESDNIVLNIEDDGLGFDVTKKSKGIGVQNMISRTDECHGIIDITSKKGHGTKISIKIPIEINTTNIT